MACDVCGLVLVWPRALQQTAARRDLAPPHSLWESEGDNCSISLLPIGTWPQVASLTGQSPCIVGIGLWHALWGVTSALFIFYCLFACLSYLYAGTHYGRL